MGHHRGMRFGREGKKHYRKFDDCLETELTPDHIFNCLAIVTNLLTISVLPTTLDLYEDKIKLIVKAVIDVHDHI